MRRLPRLRILCHSIAPFSFKRKLDSNGFKKSFKSAQSVIRSRNLSNPATLSISPPSATQTSTKQMQRAFQTEEQLVYLAPDQKWKKRDTKEQCLRKRATSCLSNPSRIHEISLSLRGVMHLCWHLTLDHKNIDQTSNVMLRTR
jgi:hypothetical protein